LRRTFFFTFGIFAICLLISIPAFAQTTTEKELDKTIVTEPKMLQVIALDEVTLGSAITSVEVTVSVTANPDQKCYLKLLDDHLTKLQISSIFLCDGIHTITLDQLGTDALESNIEKGIYKIGVVFTDRPDLLADFTISSYHISYKEPTYFAKIENNKVITVIVAYQDYVDSLSGTWIETKLDGSIRGTYAGIGYEYDPLTDIFIPPIEKELILTK